MSDWLFGLGGGVLIGTAALLLWATVGRIAGISGIFGGLLLGQRDWPWRLAFVLGLLAGGATFGQWTATRIEPVVTDPLLILAGLLVGVGTRLGNGCTSGHGICGLGRLSRRSLAAVLTFMGAAFATVFVTHHVLGG